HLVGDGERRRELPREVTSARIEVRLEEDAQAALAVALADRGDRRRDLRGVVAVVVDDRHAVDSGDLEAPAGAGEAREQRRRLVTRDARELECRQRRPRVASVVLAGKRELALP